jgi:hypothetical protein
LENEMLSIELVEAQEEIDSIRNWLLQNPDEIDGEVLDDFNFLIEIADALLKHTKEIDLVGDTLRGLIAEQAQ